jgi:magnesium transporter
MVRMNRLYRKGKKKIGIPPGTPIYVGEERKEKVKITLIDYNEEHVEEKEVEEIADCFPCKATPSVSWINVDGIHRVISLKNSESISICIL